MDYQSLVSLNLSIIGVVGDCLKYACDISGVAHGVDYAWLSWEMAVNKHTDQNFPNIPVPLFFSYIINNVDEGHVVWFVPNVGFVSSPYTTRANAQYQVGTGHAVLPTIAEIERIYGVTYVGWAEELNGHPILTVTTAPVAPPPPQYVITAITPKQVQLNKQPTTEWNLSYPTFDQVNANPFSTGNAGDIKTIVAELHSNEATLSQYTYYLESAGSPVGWNSLDCTDYTPPEAAPVVAPYVPPAGAAMVPLAQKFVAVTTLQVFSSAEDAQAYNLSKSMMTIPPATYYIQHQDGIAYDLSNSNMTDNSTWINSLYNKVTPAAATPVVTSQTAAGTEATTTNNVSTAGIKANYQPLNPDSSGVKCHVLKTVLVTDIVHTGQPITVLAGTDLPIYGTFTDGMRWYAMPKIEGSEAESSSHMYGVPIASRSNFLPYLEIESKVTRELQDAWAIIYDKAVSTIEGIFKPKQRK